MKWMKVLLITVAVGMLWMVGCGDDDSPTSSQGGGDLSNTKIAFVQDNSFFLIDIDGSNKTRLGDGDILVSNAWSPNGRNLLGVRETNSVLIDVEGAFSDRTLEGLVSYWASWSPGGGKVVWSDIHLFGETPIWIMDADGGGKQEVFSIYVKPILSRYPWSTDGNEIFFGIQDSYTEPTQSEMFRIGIDGSGKVKIGDGFAPAISPDGQKIAFARFNGISFDYFIMTADGTGTKKLGEGNGENPYDLGSAYLWSPDSKKLVLILGGEISSVSIDEGGGNEEISIKKNRLFDLKSRGRSGGEEVKVVGSALSFSPDGNKFVIEEEGVIYILNTDGSEKVQIAEGLYPSWSPFLK